MLQMISHPLVCCQRHQHIHNTFQVILRIYGLVVKVAGMRRMEVRTRCHHAVWHNESEEGARKGRALKMRRD
jgi:hypothetical protein